MTGASFEIFEPFPIALSADTDCVRQSLLRPTTFEGFTICLTAQEAGEIAVLEVRGPKAFQQPLKPCLALLIKSENHGETHQTPLDCCNIGPSILV